MTRPIEHCYSASPGRLPAGEYLGDKDTAASNIQAPLGAGVSGFIDLTHKADGLLPYSELVGSTSYQRFPIRDLSTLADRRVTVTILDAIDKHIRQGRMAYVHCWGGIGRTRVIVGCWLVRHGFEGQARLDRLHELWRRYPRSVHRESPKTSEQEQYTVNREESS